MVELSIGAFIGTFIANYLWFFIIGPWILRRWTTRGK